MKRPCASLLVVVSFLAQPARAAPPSKLECAAAHQDAQRLRRDGDLRGAREKLLVCSRDPCPKVVEDECVPWLAEVERATPSLVLEARTRDGRDVPEVRVSIDGRPTLERLDGRAIELNPGEHLLRFEPSHGGPVERRIVVAEGEKGRIFRIEVDGGTDAPAPVVAPPARDATPSGPPRAAIVAGGIGVVALGGFTFFALGGVSAEHDLRDCTPDCSASRVDAVERRYIIADVLLGVGVVALAATAYFLLTGTGR